MAYVKFNVSVSENTTAWGYTIQVTPEGVFGEVPDEMLDLEVSSGRVQAPQKQTPQDVIENGSGKRMGRPPKVQGSQDVQEVE